MKPITSFILFSSLVLSLVGLLPHQIVAINSLVEQVCQQTHNKGFCIQSFNSNPESEGATNVELLGVIALQLADKNATDTALSIDELISNKTLDPAVQQALTNCRDKYKDVNLQLDASIAYMFGNGRKDGLGFINVAIKNLQSCEDELKKSGSQFSVLLAKNAIVRQLCDNALVINKIPSAK